MTADEKNFEPQLSQQESITIRVIGDRGSGKTTYMASLAYWPNASSKSTVQNVIPFNEESNELVRKAQNILEQGLSLEPTPLDADVSNVKDYTLVINLQIPTRFSGFKLRGKKLLPLMISCKDYPGEFFSDLIQKDSHNPQLRAYLNDCTEAQGILFLVDGMAHRKDVEYAKELGSFLRLIGNLDNAERKRRIAFTLGKCEQSELWVNIHKPIFLASKRFPKTYQVLQDWQNNGFGDFECFTTSAFGMLGTAYPKPNATLVNRHRDGVVCVIKEPSKWRPLGLVNPIYWLYTGKHHKELLEG
ncbi:hypothetical protein HRE53_21530 [Acaryochloris sp. 'Moss Beach']|uniref:hypothetical protein n=1 Tax=Acaryochloris sp. 'Moss Beach' TaxID=2740837 RepID=UPI001F24CA0D|nr:hypothetical protein [Acaryochloris sp. 'Moss Beach']UJB68981.1 hypothetical protein HRE53_21530 [Acaryochloris sp. 'Moss Beach']